MSELLRKITNGNLVIQILLGIVLGVIWATALPEYASHVGFLGTFFVKALKAIAPILVFILITHAIAQHKEGQQTNLRKIIVLYIFGTLLAAIVAAVVSYIHPVHLNIAVAGQGSNPPQDVTVVLMNLLMNMAVNPVTALAEGNYIGILTWAILAGLVLRRHEGPTKVLMDNGAEVISVIVGWVVRLAPIGVFGLVAQAIHDVNTGSVVVAGKTLTGWDLLSGYAELVAVLLIAMLIVALVVNPIIVFAVTKRNPFPLVFKCLLRSGISAFFMRSSAANIPVNMQLCRELNLKEETYSISIPLGATINMAGAAITITVMALAAAYTVGVEVHPITAIVLCVIATLGACGASGVPGGSLLLIPMACSMLGIDGDIAASVIGVGYIIGVIQDSAETALNSSTDVLFTAAADDASLNQKV
ncbi:serine/threonine transporter SstT [Basilea psittacipulmonis]|uniref:Serine/threonine transporter SstT n=1 Tax=Basilea psittacipulmonis DSM 24701 TaxID=1072685 RepID=A0A077DIL0_9BURK|nr:serine/threonine transporter SstT [Basilea psittacipulmonis]AIL33307.1 serine/threonine protein kinase [Basilea psittacipulmonis DSM 24701]